MYKRASQRSGASRNRGLDFFAQWRNSGRGEHELHPLAVRLVKAARRKGGSDKYAKSLTDYWLAEIVHLLLEEDLLKRGMAVASWEAVQPRLGTQGRSIRLTDAERREGRLILASKLRYWMDEIPYSPAASLYD